MKRLINDGYDVVEEMLDGYVKAHPEDVRLSDENERVVISKHLSPTPKWVSSLVVARATNRFS